MASPTDAALPAKFSQFLADKNTQPEHRLALMAFLETRPVYSKPTSYISDIEQRLELLREIQHECKKQDFELNSTATLWSALMVVPLERLRSLRDISLNNFQMLVGTMDGVTSHVPILLKTFLAKEPSQSDLVLGGIVKKRKISSIHNPVPDEPNLDMKGRNQIESNKCEQRDRCCVVTGAANPDICHVFPFAAKKSPDRTSSGLKVVLHLWGVQVFQQLKGMLVGDGNIIDTAPNMVALQPLLHRWWGKALVGFEPIEKIENGIRLRVRWLPKTMLAMKDEVALDLNPLDLQPCSNQDGHVKITHSSTCRPIIDGTVIDITAQDETAVPSWDLFSLQWDLIRMASLCGAAEASDDDDWESDDDEAPSAKIARTKDDLSLFTTPIVQPLRSLPTMSRESSPAKALQLRESPTNTLWSRESSPTKSTQPRESLPETPRFQPLRSLPVQSRKSSPTKSSQSPQPRELSPTKFSQPRESSPAKSCAGKVDENNRW